jgi:hypothetical protein
MLIYTHCWELMNSVGSHGSLSLQFVMKVMVCHFVSDSHEAMTALIVVLPNCFCGNFSATSSSFFFHVSLVLLQVNAIVTFLVLLWSFLYNLIDMFPTA